jgi:asparagine synthase (glutamine-hydrolysing)
VTEQSLVPATPPSDASRRWPLIVLKRDHSARTVLIGQASAACGYRSDVVGRCNPYCQWSWDGKTLVAETDRYGFFPLFYHEWRDGIMLSPSIAALIQAGAPTRLDDAALAVLIRRSGFVAQDTAFVEIHAFPPGGRLIWTPSGPARVEKEFIFGRPSNLSRSAAVDGYIDCFRAAMARRPALTSAVVPLSGGRDSRHIFLEMCASGNSPAVAVTVGNGWGRTNPDGVIASELARRAGVRHVMLDLPHSRWRAQRDTMAAMQLCTLENWWLTNLVAYVRDLPVRPSVYEGVAGDVLSTSLYKKESLRRLYDKGDFAAIAESLLGPERYFEQFLSREYCRRFSRESAIAKVVNELKAHEKAPNPLASFVVYNRTRRVTALPPTTLLSPYANVWCPYLDADVWDHLSSLGPEFLEGDSTCSFHDDALRRAYPEFADVPFAGGWGGRRSFDRRTVAEMSIAVATRPPGMIRKSYLAPRLARGMLDPTYTADAATLAPLVGYVMLLEAWTHTASEPLLH